MNTAINKRKLYLVFVIIILLWSVYSLVSAVITRSTTETLKVRSSDNNASITIAQTNKQAAFLGVGNVKVRLKQGTYVVGVSDKGELATETISIDQKQTTILSLSPSQATALPSVTNIAFQGIGSLVSFGITTQQATELELDFFNFKTSAKSVDIDPSTISTPPRDPNTAIGFSLQFNVSIDGNLYNGTATYTDLTNIRLQLRDSSGNQVYDSYSN